MDSKAQRKMCVSACITSGSQGQIIKNILSKIFKFPKKQENNAVRYFIHSANGEGGVMASWANRLGAMRDYEFGNIEELRRTLRLVQLQDGQSQCK